MKKITVYTLSVAFLAAGMISCGKTTRGKMINDWNVESQTSETTYLGSNEEKLVTNEVIMDNVVTTKYTQTSADGGTEATFSTGKVNANSWAIKKDGTWIWTKELEYSEGGGQKIITEQSGTWSFVSKNKEDGFKKNERVIFNVLSNKVTQIFSTNGSVVSTDSSTDTYLTGERNMFFTVKNSSNKLLEMEMDTEFKYKNGTVNNQQTTKLTVRLK